MPRRAILWPEFNDAASGALCEQTMKPTRKRTPLDKTSTSTPHPQRPMARVSATSSGPLPATPLPVGLSSNPQSPVGSPVGSPAGTLRNRWSFFLLLYLLLFGLAELLATGQQDSLGLWLHVGLFSTLLLHAMRAVRPFRDLLTAMTVLPLIRLLAFTMPLSLTDQVNWFPMVGTPLLIGVVIAATLVGYSRKDLGLRVTSISLQLAIAVTGVLIGLLERLLVQPSALAPSFDLPHLIWPMLSLLIFTGFSEELLFRGLLQRAAVEALAPRWGIIYTSLLFSAFHLGWQSPLDVVYVGIVGAFFGFMAYRTGSIVGVSLAHGLANIMLFIILPLA